LTASAALSERGYRARKDGPIDPMTGKNASAKKEPDPARAFG
jgi:hypothetical protein